MSAAKTSVVILEPLLVARADAARSLSISESMLIELVAKGQVPKPRKISAGRSGWLVEDLRQFAKGLPVSDLLPPPNSGVGRAGKVA